MTLKLIGAAGLAAMLGGCVIVDADVRDNNFDPYPGATQLYGVDLPARDNVVAIIAPSNGCTKKSDFEPDVDHGDGNRYRVTFRREEIDRCKALMPEGERLVWTYGELGLPTDARVSVMNRVWR